MTDPAPRHVPVVPLRSRSPACATQAPPPAHAGRRHAAATATQPATCCRRCRSRRNARSRRSSRDRSASPQRAARRCVRRLTAAQVRHRSGARSRPALAQAQPSATASSPRCRARPKPSRGATTGRSSSPRHASTAARRSSPANRDALARVAAQHRRAGRDTSSRSSAWKPATAGTPAATGARCAVHAGLRLSAHRRPDKVARENQREAFFRGELGAAVRARQGNGHRHHHAQGQLCRRDGLGPVHAVELSRCTRWTATATASATCSATSTTCSPRSPTISSKKGGWQRGGPVMARATARSGRGRLQRRDASIRCIRWRRSRSAGYRPQPCRPPADHAGATLITPRWRRAATNTGWVTATST